MKTKTGVELIAAERRRQIRAEGFSAAKDDKYKGPTLARAAYSYLLVACRWHQNAHPPLNWPWLVKWWKPSEDQVRNLTKAGALIAAEIDRLQRLAKKQK